MNTIIKAAQNLVCLKKAIRAFLYMASLCFFFVLIAEIKPTYAVDKASYRELYGPGWQHEKIAQLVINKGEVNLLIFWRTDCPPCLREVALLPEILKENKTLPVTLVSLSTQTQTQKWLPLKLPKNVRVLVNNSNTKQILASFGNDKMVLPFSVGLHADGSVCGKHYGILGADTVNGWAKTC